MTLRNSKKFWKRSCKRNKSYNSGFVRTFCFVTVFAGKQNEEALTAKTAPIPALPEPQNAAQNNVILTARA